MTLFRLEFFIERTVQAPKDAAVNPVMSASGLVLRQNSNNRSWSPLRELGFAELSQLTANALTFLKYPSPQ